MKDRALLTMCDRSFLPGAAALLRGAKEYHPDVTRYCFVPECDLDVARATLGGLAEVRTPIRAIRGVPPGLQVVVSKLFAGELPHEVVAVMDADVIFCKSAEDLWEVAPGTVHAVADVSDVLLCNVPPEIREAFSQSHVDLIRQKAFNSGVFALRPSDWPNLVEDYEETIALYKDMYSFFFDQVFLNVLLRSSVKFLPRCYNVQLTFGDYAAPPDARIIHFTGSPKPWMPEFHKRRPEYYQWARHGLGLKSPLYLWPIWARCLYGKYRLSLGKLADRYPLGRRLRDIMRPGRDDAKSVWDGAISAKMTDGLGAEHDPRSTESRH